MDCRNKSNAVRFRNAALTRWRCRQPSCLNVAAQRLELKISVMARFTRATQAVSPLWVARVKRAMTVIGGFYSRNSTKVIAL
jgi:hypothetical protein